MKHKCVALLPQLIVCGTLLASQIWAQPSPGIIPANRSIDWSHAGIPGGIPSTNWPVFKILSPSGTSDDSVAIQNAINAAPSNSVVVLGAGVYKLHRTSLVCPGKTDDGGGGVYEAGICLTDKSVVLRGSGPRQTILQYGDGANIISMGRTYLQSGATVFHPITSSAPKGATSITLSSVTGISVNTFITITQNNPLDSDGNPLVNTSGNTGSCSFCGHGFSNNVMTQIDKVTAVNGNTVTLERPLYIDYTDSPQFYILPMVQSVGLENLRIVGTTSSGTNIVYKNINLEACAYCWVHNVESDMAVDRANVYLSDVYASEISNNYLNDGFSHDSGESYGVYLEFRASENLIQNNIVRKARHGTPMSGGSGNVFGYNYVVDSYMTASGVFQNYLADRGNHTAHPYMNLWEGNVTSNVQHDFVHGSSSHNTVFRNYVNLTAVNPGTGTNMTGGIFAVKIDYFNNYYNVVGNVLGQNPSGCTATAYQIKADAGSQNSIFKLGYWDDSGAPSPNLGLSAKVENTMLRGGNWDCKTNGVVWSSNVPNGSLISSYLPQQAIPASLYLASKPTWFLPNGVAWPPIDPLSNVKVNKIPAQLCYENGPKTGAAFDPATCYVTASGIPQAPSNLSAIVN
jgi:hypothetical protein